MDKSCAIEDLKGLSLECAVSNIGSILNRAIARGKEYTLDDVEEIEKLIYGFKMFDNNGEFLK